MGVAGADIGIVGAIVGSLVPAVGEGVALGGPAVEVLGERQGLGQTCRGTRYKGCCRVATVGSDTEDVGHIGGKASKGVGGAGPTRGVCRPTGIAESTIGQIPRTLFQAGCPTDACVV